MSLGIRVKPVSVLAADYAALMRYVRGRPVADGVFEILHTFTGPDGVGPWAQLIEGSDGARYGSTLSGRKHLLGQCRPGRRLSKARFPRSALSGSIPSKNKFLLDGPLSGGGGSVRSKIDL